MNRLLREEEEKLKGTVYYFSNKINDFSLIKCVSGIHYNKFYNNLQECTIFAATPLTVAPLE